MSQFESVEQFCVQCRGSSAMLIGGALEGGRAKIGLDALIELQSRLRAALLRLWEFANLTVCNIGPILIH